MEKQIFNKTAALALVDNDEEILRILIDSFVQVAFSLDELDRLVKEKQFRDAAAYVHKTKGAARQLCLERLAEAGQSLEDALRGKTAGDIGLLAKAVAKEHTSALAAVGHFGNA